MKQRVVKYTLLILLMPVLVLIAQERDPFIDPLLESVHFAASCGDTLYTLPHPFIIPASLHIAINGNILIRDRDYHLKRRSLPPVVEFTASVNVGDSIRIQYRRFPVNLKARYQHWQEADTVLSTEVQEKAVKRMSTGPARIDQFTSALSKSGSVFRGISLGTNQSMKLQSGLRLQVSGQIAPGVEVLASLTDQNTPIQPEGNTQTLQEIDKVFVQVTAPGLKGVLGDFIYQSKPSRFGSYERKLQGAMGRAESDFGSISVSAAASRGEFFTNKFLGNEGNQGPYQLTGAQGQREMIVLAGTEKVWIDGELMTRGEDNDYTIEYGSGQILFTRNRLITDDSRITVDFEYSDLKFQKEIYGAQGELNLWENRIKLNASWLTESDDKDNPLEIPLTDEYRNVLSMAGDAPDSALVTGIQAVGPGKGNYVKVDTGAVVFYRYAGLDSGDYAIRFSYVGQGHGDYSFQGYGIYRYAGKNKGAYIPRIYLPLAARHQSADINVSFQLADGITAGGEIGLSDRDLNLYSNLDDRDNVDLAYHAALNVDERELRISGLGFGKVSFQALYNDVGEHFRAAGRMVEVEHGRKWGLKEGVFWGEKLWEMQGSYSPFSGLKLAGETGRLWRNSDERSRRVSGEGAFRKDKWPEIDYKVERLNTVSNGLKGGWFRHRGNAAVAFWIVKPAIHYTGEHKKEDDPDSIVTGFRYDEWRGGVTFGRDKWRGLIEETFRYDHRYEGGTLKRYSTARTDRAKMDIRWSNHFSTSLMLTHRERDYWSLPGDQKADLADMKVRFTPFDRLLDGSFNYRYSSSQVSEMVRDTIVVGPGLGMYRYDDLLGEYVPDPDGDILFRNIQTGVFLPVNDLKLGGEIRIDGSRVWKGKRGIRAFLGGVRGRTLIRIERRDKKRGFLDVNRSAFSPEWGLDSTTVSGIISLYQDMEYATAGRRFSIRIRVKDDRSEDNQLIREGLLRHRREFQLRIKTNPIQTIGLLGEFNLRKEKKTYAQRVVSNRDIDAWSLIVETSYRPVQKLEMALKAEYSKATDGYPDPAIRGLSFFIIPRLVYSLKSRGQVRAEFEAGNVSSTPENAALPYELFSGDQPGLTLRWNMLVSYRITGHVMTTLSYRGRQEPWRERLYQTGQVEVRAFF